MKPATVITASARIGKARAQTCFRISSPVLRCAIERGPSQSRPRFHNIFRSPTPYIKSTQALPGRRNAKSNGSRIPTAVAHLHQDGARRGAQPPSPTFPRIAPASQPCRNFGLGPETTWESPSAGSIGALGKYDVNLKDRGTPPSSPTFADAAVYSGPALSENSQPCQNYGGTQRGA